MVASSTGYVCPFCTDRVHSYRCSDDLERHVHFYHGNTKKDDPLLREALAQGTEGESSSPHQHGKTLPDYIPEFATGNPESQGSRISFLHDIVNPMGASQRPSQVEPEANTYKRILDMDRHSTAGATMPPKAKWTRKKTGKQCILRIRC
ncbi:hypothetical protein CC80DRAFT_251531 [Byssothecium circinans]|uniref:C2H2-type domain-containing protein n=1 Tax=Byssothecium circinans TaxID=147558 RepID=A0A6A5TAS9_9PLEO|nr:hypothetical protein CC80DRAFT_251531 [Byssothecium circinans]